MADLTAKQYVDFEVIFENITIDGAAIDVSDFGSWKCKIRNVDGGGSFIPGGVATLTTAAVAGDSTSYSALASDTVTSGWLLTKNTSTNKLPIIDLHFTRTSDSKVFSTPTRTVEIVEGPAHD